VTAALGIIVQRAPGLALVLFAACMILALAPRRRRRRS